MSFQNGHQVPLEVIYRRRRIAAVAVLAILIVIIVTAFNSFNAPSGSNATPTNTNSADTAVTECAPGVVSIEVFAGDGTSRQSAFSAGVNPYLWFTLNNTGTVDCNFNAGSAVTFFTITSGDQTIWSSKQCDRTGDVDGVITLKAGSETRANPSQWMRVFSSATGCGAEQAPASAGGASYHLTVEVNGVLSGNDEQFLLN